MVGWGWKKFPFRKCGTSDEKQKKPQWIPPVSKEEMQWSTMDRNPLGAAAPEWKSGVCWVTQPHPSLERAGKSWIWVGSLCSWALTSYTVQAHLCLFLRLPWSCSSHTVRRTLCSMKIYKSDSELRTLPGWSRAWVLMTSACLRMQVAPYGNGHVKAEEEKWCNFFLS